MSGQSDKIFIIWPMYQYEKDFDTLEKVGEGHYGKVYSAKRKHRNVKTAIDECRYALNFFIMVFCK